MTARAMLPDAVRRLPVAGSAFAAGTGLAAHLTGPRFCALCGELRRRTERLGDDRGQPVSPAYGRVDYPNAKPSAGTIVVDGRSVLLIRGAMEPHRGWWDIPGGFLEVGELLGETDIREVPEETVLKVTLTHLAGFYPGNICVPVSAIPRSTSTSLAGRCMGKSSRAMTPLNSLDSAPTSYQNGWLSATRARSSTTGSTRWPTRRSRDWELAGGFGELCAPCLAAEPGRLHSPKRFRKRL